MGDLDGHRIADGTSKAGLFACVQSGEKCPVDTNVGEPFGNVAWHGLDAPMLLEPGVPDGGQTHQSSYHNRLVLS